MIEIKKITDVTQYVAGLQGIIFDLDDTLYSEKEYVRSGFNAVSKILTEIDNVECRLWSFFENKQNAIDELLCEEGIYSSEVKQKCLDEYRFHFPDIHLYDGVYEMITELRKKGYLLGIITDGRVEGQRNKIQALGLEKHFDWIIITDELGGIESRKPNEVSFVKMQNNMKLDFSQMCYIGDNIKKDFIAPQKLGMKCIWFQNKDGIYTNI